MTELRCDHKMHAVINNGMIEVKCSSKLCGAGPGKVVIHRFDKETGDYVETLKYRDANYRR